MNNANARRLRGSAANTARDSSRWRAVEETLLLHGLPPEIASAWQDWWEPGQNILRVIDDAWAYLAEGVPVNDAALWHRHGFAARIGSRLYRLGWTPEEGVRAICRLKQWARLEPWLDTGLTPAEVLRYIDAGIRPSEVEMVQKHDDVELQLLNFLTALRRKQHNELDVA